MALLFHILLFKIRIFFKLAAELSARNVVKHAASAVVFGGFALGAYMLARGMTEYLLVQAHLGLFLLHRFLSMLLFVFFLSVNLGNIIVSYATFYRSKETEFFLTKPIPHAGVFLIKFLDNFFYSSTVLFIIIVAVLLGYGSYFRMPALFYVETIVGQFIPFMLIAGCLAVAALLVLMRFAPRWGAWRMTGALLLFYAGSLWGYFKSSNPFQLVESVMRHYPRVDAYFAGLDPPFARFLPNQWIAESLYWTMRGEGGLALQYTFFSVLMAAIAFFGMLLTARAIFYKSWISSLALRRASAERSSVFAFLSLTRPSRIDPQTSVILRKEFWQFAREPSQWIHLGIIMFLIVSFLTSVVSLNFETRLPLYLSVSYMTLLIFNAFLLASIALRFVFPMVSVEGQSFWSMLSAPVHRSKIYLIKLGTALIPTLAIGLILALLSHWSIARFALLPWIASIVMTCVAVTLVNVNLASGAYFSDYREQNPIKVASSQSATLTFLMSIVYLTILVAVLFVPVKLYFFHQLKGGEDADGMLWYATGALVVLSVMISLLSLALGLRTLKRDF